MKKITFAFALILFAFGGLNAQKAWIDPPTITDVNDSVTVYVDISKCDCQRLLNTVDDVFMWSWNPADPVPGNGDWTASNPDMIMTPQGNNIWSKTIHPGDFYGVANAQPFYDNGISFLAKLSDGTGLGGGGCDEDKTEDLNITIDPPFVPQQKVIAFPAADATDSLYIRNNDIFTIKYDNTIEDKVSMQNATDLYVYARCSTSTGTEIKVANLNQVGNTPELQMTNNGDGTFTFMIIPERLFGTAGSGNSITSMRFQIMKPVLQNSDDAVDGIFEYFFRCN